MNSYTLSLSRWYKVAERLARTYTELTTSVRNTFNNTQVTGYMGNAQVTRLKEQRDQQQGNLSKAFELQDTLIRIRQALGEANTRTGVGKELAEYDALSRRHKLLESMLSAQSSDMVTLEEMPELPDQLAFEDRYHNSTKGAVRVRLLDSEAQQALRTEAEKLLARVYALADRISDLNKERLTLEMPEEIAKGAGL